MLWGRRAAGAERHLRGLNGGLSGGAKGFGEFLALVLAEGPSQLGLRERQLAKAVDRGEADPAVRLG